jgi:hypothetical protein
MCLQEDAAKRRAPEACRSANSGVSPMWKNIIAILFIPLLIWFLYKEFGVGEPGDREKTVRIGHMYRTSPSGAFIGFALFFLFVFIMAIIGLFKK